MVFQNERYYFFESPPLKWLSTFKKRVSCPGHYDRIDNLTTFKLGGNSAVFKCFDRLFVCHVFST